MMTDWSKREVQDSRVVGLQCTHYSISEVPVNVVAKKRRLVGWSRFSCNMGYLSHRNVCTLVADRRICVVIFYG